jgi:membrane-bound lytic murein transglycosylase MltF
MPRHSHRFVEEYQGLVGFGLDRTTDEATVRCYLQKFADDALTAAILPRLEDAELAGLFDRISQLLRRHLSEDEYHRLFLKEEL